MVQIDRSLESFLSVPTPKEELLPPAVSSEARDSLDQHFNEKEVQSAQALARYPRTSLREDDAWSDNLEKVLADSKAAAAAKLDAVQRKIGTLLGMDAPQASSHDSSACRTQCCHQ